MTTKRHVREGIGTLYRGLAKAKTFDKTYERERMRVMQILSLLPKLEEDNEVDTMRPGSAHLGLYARHRPNSSNSQKRNTSHPNMCKKAKDRQNKCMHSPYNDIPIQPTRKYSGSHSPHGASQKQETLAQNKQTRSLQQNRKQKARGTNSHQKVQRLSTHVSATSQKSPAKNHVKYSRNADDIGCKPSFQSDSKWPEVERRRLNELYWELGKPKRSGRLAMNDHLDSYVRRHQVIFKDRPAKEIKDRVRHMLQYNQFKEMGEEQYWRSFQSA